MIIDLTKELKYNHTTWDEIRKFAKVGGKVSNITLYNTVNRVEYAKIFWNLIKDQNIKTEKEIEDKFNKNGIIVFAAELNGKIIGMMVFDLTHKQVAEYKGHKWEFAELIADYWLAGYDENTHIGASYALMHEAIQFLRQIDCSYINIGEGENSRISKEDLIDWKAGWIGESKKTFQLRGNKND